MITSKRYPCTILATAPVPWDSSYWLDTPLFDRVVQSLVIELSPHLYLFGTAGEGYAVTDTQFLEITQRFRSLMPRDTHPMVGVISLSLPTMIERIEKAWDLGISDFQLSLPSWGALTDGEVDTFFAETCGRFPECRFLHYNLLRTKRLLTGDDYARLSKKHPNLVAIKMGGENLTAFEDILEKAPELQCFFTEFGYGALRDRYECGLLSAITACNPQKAHAFFNARGESLARLLAECRLVHRAVKQAIDPAQTHMDGVYDKIYAKHQFPDFPLRLLPPYAYSDDEAVARFRQNLPPSWIT